MANLKPKLANLQPKLADIAKYAKSANYLASCPPIQVRHLRKDHTRYTAQSPYLEGFSSTLPPDSIEPAVLPGGAFRRGFV